MVAYLFYLLLSIFNTVAGALDYETEMYLTDGLIKNEDKKIQKQNKTDIPHPPLHPQKQWNKDSLPNTGNTPQLKPDKLDRCVIFLSFEKGLTPFYIVILNYRSF